MKENPRRRRAGRIATAAVATGLPLVACGGEGRPAPTEAAATTTASASATTEARTTQTPSPDVQRVIDCRQFSTTEVVDITDARDLKIIGDINHGFVIASQTTPERRGGQIEYSTESVASTTNPLEAQDTASMVVSEGAAVEVDVTNAKSVPEKVICDLTEKQPGKQIPPLQEDAINTLNGFLEEKGFDKVDAQTVDTSGKKSPNHDKNRIYNRREDLIHVN